jgi:hypothetical protein
MYTNSRMYVILITLRQTKHKNDFGKASLGNSAMQKLLFLVAQQRKT